MAEGARGDAFTFACDSALRWASMDGWRERPSMLFACGSEESEHARLGSATSESGGFHELAEILGLKTFQPDHTR